MTKQQWKVFCDFKDVFKCEVEKWRAENPELTDLQKKAAHANRYGRCYRSF